MVLEHLFPEDWLEKKLRYAFLLAVIYGLVSIAVARLLFAANSGLVAVVFTSILLLPVMQKLFKKEEMAEMNRKVFTLTSFFKDNLPVVKVYGILFLGIYVAYMLAYFIPSYFGLDFTRVFGEQLALETGIRGNAFSIDLFSKIFLNNWWVLLACFMLALVTGDGAIFFITWNASTWGTIFAFRALEASAAGVGDPIINLLTIVIITLPHLLLEGGAYILAAIAGTIISDDVVSVSKEIPHFLAYLIGAVLFFVFLVFMISLVVDLQQLRGLLYITIASILLWILSWAFDKNKHRQVFQYNVQLFYAAIALFFIGAAVEAWVLGSNSLLLNLYYAAM